MIACLRLTSKKKLTSESTIANQNAGQKPRTVKPGTMFDARIIKSALITKEKRPRVTTVSGNVKTKRMGFKNILINPRTTARISAPKIVTVTPGIR